MLCRQSHAVQRLACGSRCGAYTVRADAVQDLGIRLSEYLGLSASMMQGSHMVQFFRFLMRVSSSCNLWSLFNKRAFRVHYAGAIRNSFSKPTQEKLTTAHTYEIIHPARKKLCSEIMIISRTVSKLRLARINEENRKIEKSKRHELITQSDIIRVRGLKTEASQTISPQKT